MKKRRNQQEENHNNERWLVSYADFITLLFAFFTVMYATSQADNEKLYRFEQSVKKAFGIGVLAHDGGTGVLTEAIPTYQKEGSPIEPQIQLFYDPKASRAEVKDLVWYLLEQKLTADQIKESGINVFDDEQGVRITLSSESLFEEGSSQILEKGIKSLDVLGEILLKSGKRIVIEGHTDNTKIQSKEFPSNWELAAVRASKVVRYLISRHKIPSDIISVASYADQRPLYKNDTSEHRSKNRRIEVLIRL